MSLERWSSQKGSTTPGNELGRATATNSCFMAYLFKGQRMWLRSIGSRADVMATGDGGCGWEDVAVAADRP